MPEEASPRTAILAFAVVVVAVVGGALLLLVTRPDPVQITIIPPLPTATPAPTGTPPPLLIYVTGAVARPGQTYSLPPGSRVADGINVAGGPAANADLQRVNLAGILRDGDQVHVPEIGEAVVMPTPGGSGIVHVNRATAEELSTLPGIGPAIAQRIIDFREANGPFTRLEDLDAVNGIGPRILEDLAGRIEFD